MHHFAVKNNFVDTNSAAKNADPPLCPKPRRLISTSPSSQFLNHPLPCSNHKQVNSDGRSAILNIIAEKTRMEIGSEIVGCSKCPSTSYEWCGSPPTRTDNPLVQDAHFLRRHAHLDNTNVFSHYATADSNLLSRT